MGIFNRNNEGYSRGGMDVESAVNLFFKGVLLFPVFLFAGYIGLAMMKHVIFHGIPSMTAPSREQQERIHERNHQIGLEDGRKGSEVELKDTEVRSPAPLGLSVDMQERVHHQEATEAFQRDFVLYQQSYRKWVECVSEGRRCELVGEKPSFSDYYDPSKYYTK
tara:strand:- start:562 stop:1053 length:492 start_codon:yes stop_codon:yes gene_type:complete